MEDSNRRFQQEIPIEDSNRRSEEREKNLLYYPVQRKIYKEVKQNANI